MSDKDLSKPAAWNNEEELRDVRRVGFGEMFYADAFVCDAKNVDLNRVIPSTPPNTCNRCCRVSRNWNVPTRLPAGSDG